MQRFQKWDLSRGWLKNFLLILLLLSASAITLHVLSVSAGSNMPMQLALNGESETERPVLRPTPILTINKDDDPPDKVQPGAVLTYTITYSNVGDAKATEVIIIDTFDNKVTFERSWPSPTGSAGNVRYWQIGDLHKGDRDNITATVMVSTSAVSGTVLSNLVQIDSPDAEMASSTETTTVVCPVPILAINKDDDPPDKVQCGAVLTYTITYSNVGDADATGVIITDTFGDGLTFESSWPSPTGGAGNVRYWEIGVLHPGDRGNITALVTVSTSAVSGTVLTNLAQIDSPDAEMVSDTETTTVIVVKRYIYLPIITKSYPKSMFEGFEAGVVPPSDWTLIQTNPNETWKIDTIRLTPHSGSYYATVKCDLALLDQDELLLSPAFTADTGRIHLWSFGSLYWCRDTYDNCDLEVWFVNGSWGGGDDVLLGKTDDDWTSTWEWSYSTFDFSPYASGNPARIALRYVGNDGAKIGVDDITITYYPP